MSDTLSPELLQKMEAYWRAANYLTVGQTYLKDNPLLEVPLRLETMGEPFGYSRRRPRQLHARH